MYTGALDVNYEQKSGWARKLVRTCCGALAGARGPRPTRGSHGGPPGSRRPPPGPPPAAASQPEPRAHPQSESSLVR